MPGSFLLAGLVFGLDSFLVSVPLGAIELSPLRRRRLALSFGACDGLATGLGALLPLAGVRFFIWEPVWIAPALIAGYGLFVITLGLGVSADGSGGKGGRLLFALPVLLSLDNFVGGSASSISAPEVVAGAVELGAISGAMSLAGLAVGAMLVRCMSLLMPPGVATPFAKRLGACHSARLAGGLVLAAVAMYCIETLS